jgi:hypothetical protein
MEFEFNLAQLVDVGMPAIKALACLEANESTAADVFIVISNLQFRFPEVL